MNKGDLTERCGEAAQPGAGVTPWFPKGTSPSREGMYEIRCKLRCKPGIGALSRMELFDGDKEDWLSCKHCEWRGLTKRASGNQPKRSTRISK